jgi:IS5 family transposase
VEQVLADAGYRSEENFAVLEEAGIDGYVSIGRESKKAKKSDLPATTRMRKKLATQQGRDRYRKRKHVVEPAFGWVKNVLGFRAFGLRGLPKVNGEWNLVCLALNLRRMEVLWS